ncbi:MAG: hypothetical protein ACRCVI_00810 [Mycoplasmoidaceae bacterium]
MKINKFLLAISITTLGAVTLVATTIGLGVVSYQKAQLQSYKNDYDRYQKLLPKTFKVVSINAAGAEDKVIEGVKFSYIENCQINGTFLNIIKWDPIIHDQLIHDFPTGKFKLLDGKLSVFYDDWKFFNNYGK